MKKQTKIIENEKNYRGGVRWYREKIVEMAGQIEDETMLKKIYTFTKTLKNILNEKEGD